MNKGPPRRALCKHIGGTIPLQVASMSAQMFAAQASALRPSI